MSLDESGGGVHGRRPSLRGTVYARVVNGQETFSAWPRKRGKKLNPKTLAQMEIFRQVQWAFKYSDANVQISYSRAVKGTPLMPRDLFLMAVSGRMFSIVDDAGQRWWSMASRGSISQSLDVLTDVPGSLLFRGPELWQPISIGLPGQVLLISAGGDGLAEWGDMLPGPPGPAGPEGPAGPGGPAGPASAWGTIPGTLSSQTDLQSALDAKLDDSQATAFGLALLGDASAATGRATLGISDIAGSWTAYTPTAAPTSGALTSYTTSGGYRVLGDVVFFHATVAITNKGTAAGSLDIGLPFICAAADAGFNFSGRTNDNNKTLCSFVRGDSLQLARTNLYDGTTPMTVAAENLLISGCYRTDDATAFTNLQKR